jgi:phage baseplate assembly protein W
MALPRQDYAFPFRIDPVSRQAQQAGYQDHVKQLVIQVLLTSPGERADLPEFGCGLRALLFAGNSDALSATLQLLVQQSLGRWLSDHLRVRTVQLLPPESTADENEVQLRVEYVLVSTGTQDGVDVRVT